MKTQLLFLDPHDDAASTLEKLRWVQADRVVLVWPSHGRILHRRVDLVLLSREAGRQAARLAVLSHDPDVRGEARHLGMPVFDDLDAVSRQVWPELAVAPRAALQRETKPLPPRPARDGAAPQARWTDARRAGSMLVVIAALAALSVAIGPAAVIELRPVEREEILSIRVDLDGAGADPGTLTVPSRPLQVEVDGQILTPTSGTVQIGTSPATGQVTVTNRGPEDVLLPQATGLRTLGPSAQRFETTEAAVVPAGIGSQVIVPIQASAAGPAGNIEAGTIGAIEGNLGLILTVTNDEPTSGGLGEARAGVTPEDLRLARQSLERQLLQAANAELQQMLGENERLAPESVVLHEVLSSDFRPALGQASEVVQGAMAARVEASAYDKNRLQLEAEAALARSLGPGRAIVPGSTRIELRSATSGGRPSFEALVRARSRPEIDLGTLARAIAGRSFDEAASRIGEEVELAAPPRFQMWPAWWPRLPLLALRVEPVWARAAP